MANTINILKPSVCYEVLKVIGISSGNGNCKTYQVQWAPTWISGAHLIGCEDLIEQFEMEQNNRAVNIKIETTDESGWISDGSGSLAADEHYSMMQDDNQEVVILPDQQITEIHNNGTVHIETEYKNHNRNTKSLDAESCITDNENKGEVTRNLGSDDSDLQYRNTFCDMRSKDECIILSFQSDKITSGNTNVSAKSENNMDIVPSHRSNISDNDTELTQPVRYYNEEGALCLPESKPLNSSETTLLKNESIGNIVCHICYKTFHSYFHLQNHTKLHSTITTPDDSTLLLRKFFCNVCKKKFTHEARLQDHVCKPKAKNNSNQCSFCEKLFSKPSYLLRHVRIHTGERPFKCEICERGFSQKHYVKTHMINVHGKEAITMVK